MNFWALFDDDLRAREREPEEKGTTNSAPQTLVCVAENNPVRLCFGKNPKMALMDCSKPRLRSLSPSSRTRTSCKQKKITLKYRVTSLRNHGLRDQEISLFCFLLERGSSARILYDDLTSKLFENNCQTAASRFQLHTAV